MDFDKLTIGEAKKIVALFQADKEEKHPYTLGDTWFFRTVTYHLVGEIKSVGKQEIILKGGTVMWIADDGRFTDAISKGEFNETEIYGDQDVVLGRGSIIDATRLKTNIQAVQK
jgi:hypothetical protein